MARDHGGAWAAWPFSRQLELGMVTVMVSLRHLRVPTADTVVHAAVLVELGPAPLRLSSGGTLSVYTAKCRAPDHSGCQTSRMIKLPLSACPKQLSTKRSLLNLKEKPESEVDSDSEPA